MFHLVHSMVKHKVYDAGKVSCSVFSVARKNMLLLIFSLFDEYGTVLRGIKKNY